VNAFLANFPDLIQTPATIGTTLHEPLTQELLVDARFVRTDLFRGDFFFVQKVESEFSNEIPGRVDAAATGSKVAMSFGHRIESVLLQNGSDTRRILAAHFEDAKHELNRQQLLEGEPAKESMLCAAGSALLA
jgi:hypothetical protein